jgi:hypothetical protein
LSAYTSLGKLLQSGTVVNLTLRVTDNKFNAEKCRALYDIISRSSLKGFSFWNVAGFYDIESD